MMLTNKQKAKMARGFGKLAQAFLAGAASRKKNKKSTGSADLSGVPVTKPAGSNCGACG